eukprot:138380_1
MIIISFHLLFHVMMLVVMETVTVKCIIIAVGSPDALYIGYGAVDATGGLYIGCGAIGLPDALYIGYGAVDATGGLYIGCGAIGLPVGGLYIGYDKPSKPRVNVINNKSDTHLMIFMVILLLMMQILLVIVFL